MNSRLQNQLNMVGTCITLANNNDFKSVWDGNEPAAFGDDLALLTTDYGQVSAAHSLALAATGGGGDEKALAETTLEALAYTVARACACHFRKTGDADRRGKINLTKTDIARLRDRELVDQAKAIRDIAQAAAAEPGATARGITAARLASLTAAIAAFDGILTKPRGQVVNRSILLKEVATDTAALLEDLRDLDDLIPQFAESEPGQRFAQAWQKARIIIDAGGGPKAEEDEQDDTPAPQAP